VVVIMCSVGIEFITATWSGDLLVEQTGVSAAQGTAMVSTVIAGMAVGRFLIGRLALQYPEVPLLLAAFALTFAGWLIVWNSHDVAVSLLGLALTGLGIAGQYPLAMTLCVRAAPGMSDKAVGVAGSAIGVAIGIGPFALGALADATDLHTAFVVVPTLIAVAAIVLVLVRSRSGTARGRPGG
jgi:fucose permease